MIYVIPFIFVLDVAFILQGPWHQSLQAFAEAIVGAWFICAGLQGYLAGVGSLASALSRTLIAIGGLAIALPQLNWVLDNPPSNVVGLVLGLVLVGAGLLAHRFTPNTPTPV